MDAPTRARLRAALAERFEWLAHADFGPAAVEAGECDACGAEARLVATCGPGVAQYLGRQCLGQAGVDAFCDGHRDEARAALAYVASLPEEADVIARIWWVSTGEVRFRPQDAGVAEQLIGLPMSAAVQP